MRVPPRYTAIPELYNAINSHRTARIAADLERTPLNIYKLRCARALERKMRIKYTRQIANMLVADKQSRAHAKRYAYQLASRGRTTTAAPAMHQTRNERRRAARQAADAKREANYLQNW